MNKALKLAGFALFVCVALCGCLAEKKPAQATATGADQRRHHQVCSTGNDQNCDPDSSSQESVFLKALAGAAKYKVENGLGLFLCVQGLEKSLRFHAIL